MLNPWPFFGIYMLININLATYWTAVDSWIPIIFPERLKARGSYGRWFGIASGGFIGNRIFILLNSKTFCRKIFNSEQQIIKKSEFLWFTIVWC